MRKTVETDEKVHPENNGSEENKNQTDNPAEENMKKSKKSQKTSKETEEQQQNDQPAHIEQLKQKIQELEDQNIRLRAEFANYKKRVEREQVECFRWCEINIRKINEHIEKTGIGKN